MMMTAINLLPATILWGAMNADVIMTTWVMEEYVYLLVSLENEAHLTQV